MTTALEQLRKRRPIWPIGLVGLRTLPEVNVQYYGRTPKEYPFKTIWVPVNGSRVKLKDKNQDLMHMFYSRILDDENCDKTMEENFPSCYQPTLNDIPEEDKEKYKEQYRLPPARWPTMPWSGKRALWKSDRNSLSPFVTLGRPTCGNYFNYDADNKRRLIGILPSNIVKWRSHRIINTR